MVDIELEGTINYSFINIKHRTIRNYQKSVFVNRLKVTNTVNVKRNDLRQSR